MQILFYRYQTSPTTYSVGWTSQDLSEHLNKHSRFVWWCSEIKTSRVIKSFHYTSIDLTIDYKLSYSQRYQHCNAICKFLETLPFHKPLPVINKSTHPEFYI